LRSSVFSRIVYLILLCLLLSGQGLAFPAINNFTPTEYVVRKIYIDGNKRYSERYLKRKMNLKDKQFTRTKTFTRRLIELDRLLIESLYVKDGYLYCSVKDSFKVFDSGDVDLYYSIREGKQYILKNITIRGAESLDEKKILSLLDHKVDKPYNPIQIRAGIKAISYEYSNIGKPLAVISDSLTINDGIHLKISITENQTMRIGEVKVVNNQLVKTKPIRREIIFHPGDLYSQEKLELSKRHIFETGLFSSANIRLADIDTVKHILNLVADVRELDMHYLGLDFGLGQDRGILSGNDPYTSFEVTGEWLHRNMFGRGSRLSTSVTTSLNLTNILSRPMTEAEILWVEPWLLGFRSSNTFRLFVENQLLEEQEKTTYGGEAAVIYQPNKRFYLKTMLQMQGIRWKYDPAPGDYSESELERAISFNLRRDYRDNFLFPKSGTLMTFTGKIVGLVLGGTQDYFKLETAFSQYFNVFGPFVLAGRAKIGWITSFTKKETPVYEKFYLGGETSLRGWKERKLFTDDGTLDGTALGKDIKVLTNAEIRFPLFWLLGCEVFIDGGNLADSFSDLKSQTYRWNTGIGLTIASPLGPIRIDYAKKLNPKTLFEKEELWQIQFGIPYSF